MTVVMSSIKTFQEDIDKAINALSLEKTPKELYQPVEYILSLGGKRLRPLLVMLGNSLFNGKPEWAINPAIAIEVFHNFTLIHDDIMDKAPLRRGHATVHEKWNSDIAILSGDAMMIQAYELIIQTRVEFLPKLLPLFNRTALEVCEGQQEDMNFETRDDVSIGEYMEMIGKKTAVLLGCALEVGAITANASEDDRKNIYAFGKNIGIAFQLRDDLLDAYAKEDFGKQVGGDIIANKKTYLLLKAFELADASDKAKLQQLLEDETIQPPDKVREVKALYNKLSIPEHTEALSKQYFDKAMIAMDAINGNPETKATLIEYVRALMGREV